MTKLQIWWHETVRRHSIHTQYGIIDYGDGWEGETIEQYCIECSAKAASRV